MFLNRNMKNNVNPCKPQFYYIKVGLKGSKLYRYVFVMVSTDNDDKNKSRILYEPGQVQDCMCAQRRLTSACESAHSDQSLPCLPDDALDLWISILCLRRLIRLRE